MTSMIVIKVEMMMMKMIVMVKVMMKVLPASVSQ